MKQIIKKSIQNQSVISDMMEEKPGQELPIPTKIFIVAFFTYELLYVMGVFSTQYFYILGPSHKAISLGLIIILTFLIKRARKNDPGPVPWYDYILMIVGAIGCFYIAPTAEIVKIQLIAPEPTTFELILGITTILILLEGTRRASGIILPLILILFIFYSVEASHFPGILYGRGHSFTRVMGEIYLSMDGIFGRIMGLWTRILVVFLVFGGFLQASGAGKFFIELSLALAGHRRGGPAKVAVISSGLFGTISGSAAADAAVTGVITIPMMEKVGYRPEFAGAVEAVASNGGVLMPPIMGMVAFLVAEFLNIPYVQVLIAAIIPAFLYYITLYMLVDFESIKQSLKGLPKSELPTLKETLKKGWFFFRPNLGYHILSGSVAIHSRGKCNI